MRSSVRLLVAALALVTVAGCKPLDDAMVSIFGRSMRNQRSFDPYENTRQPPEHSISFASGNFPSAEGVVNIGQPEGLEDDVPPLTPRDLAPPGSEVVQSLVNPVKPTPESLARGQVLFERICAVCHGLTGIGVQAFIAPKHPTVAAYNLAGPVVQAYSDGYIYAMMRMGRGLMPPYAHQISHFDRWNIVNYIRQLQRDYNERNAAQDGER